jgi:dTDP-4-amino-4,6-dideoxygalactose transaminase
MIIERNAQPIPLFKVHMPESVMEPLRRTLLSGYIGQGERVAEFEKALYPWVGSKYCLAMNSGTSALHLAYRLAGVGPEMEVISTPITCSATNLPIVALGGRIRWADVDPATGLIDPADAKTLITSKTRAIVCVDWGGSPCEMKALHEIADEAEIWLIEDAAHAFGSQFHRRRPGGWSDLCVLSFQAIKHLTTGDGGLLICRSKGDYERGRLLRWYGLDRERVGKGSSYDQLIVDPGYKFHMNDIAATIGLEQLGYVRAVLERHRHAASYYIHRFKDRKIKSVWPVGVPKTAESSWWIFTVLSLARDQLADFLAAQGIASLPVHRRNDEHPCFVDFWERALPGVDEFASRELAIPCGWWLEDGDLRRIMDAIEEFDKGGR